MKIIKIIVISSAICSWHARAGEIMGTIQQVLNGQTIAAEGGVTVGVLNAVRTQVNPMQPAREVRSYLKRALPSGASGDSEVIPLDGGSSVGLGYTNPDDAMTIQIKGGKHTGQLPFYYINTYLLFRCEKAR